MTSPAMFRSLQIRNYRIFFWGGTVSNIGVWMQRTAQAWAVVVLSHGDGLALGIATFLQFFPTVLLGLGAGALVDRVDKVRLLIVTQALVGLGSVVIGSPGRAGDPHPGAGLRAGRPRSASITAFDVPARQSVVSELVGPEQVVNAIGLNSASFNVARLIGPAAGRPADRCRRYAVDLLPARGQFGRHPDRSAADRPLATATPCRARLRRGRSSEPASGRWPVIPLLATLIVLAGVIGDGRGEQPAGRAAAGRDRGVRCRRARASGWSPRVWRSAVSPGALLAASTQRDAAAPLGHRRRGGARRLPGDRVGDAGTGCLRRSRWCCCGGMFMTFAVLANTSVQLTAEPALRGRVVAVYLTFFLGGGALGAPLLGVLAEQFGPMRAIGLRRHVRPAAAAAGAVAVGPRWPSAHPETRREFHAAEFPSIRLPARYRSGRSVKHRQSYFEHGNVLL